MVTASVAVSAGAAAAMAAAAARLSSPASCSSSAPPLRHSSGQHTWRPARASACPGRKGPLEQGGGRRRRQLPRNSTRCCAKKNQDGGEPDRSSQEEASSSGFEQSMGPLGEDSSSVSMSNLYKRIEQLRMRELDHEQVVRANWRTGKGKLTALVSIQDFVRRVKFQGDLIACGTYRGKVLLVDTQNKRLVGQFVGHNTSTTCLDYDGVHLVAGAGDGMVRVWDTTIAKKGRNYEGTLLSAHTGAVTCVQLYGGKVYSGSEDGFVRVWDAVTGQLLHELERGRAVLCLHRSEDYLVSGDVSGAVTAWSVRAWRRILSFKVHSGGEAVHCLQYDDESKELMTGCADGSITVWDCRDGKFVRSMRGHTGPVLSLQADKYKLVTASSDGSIRGWDRQSGEQFYLVHGYTPYLGALQFDANRMVTDGANNVIIVHDFSKQP
eukprot:jgi/Chlat1/1484/Chrsp12S02015